MINILGDSYGAAIVYHLSKKELEEQDRQKALEEAEQAEKDALELEEGLMNDTQMDGKVAFKGRLSQN